MNTMGDTERKESSASGIRPDSEYPLYQRLMWTGWVPDAVLRRGARLLIAERLREIPMSPAELQNHVSSFAEQLRRMPIAVQTKAANDQHYEVPAEFYDLCLGKRKKYSSCLYPPGVTTLEDAEDAMFELTCERAEVVDGHEILDLGCGWGSLTLWLLEHYPSVRVTSVSNSKSQGQYIMAQARKHGWEDRLTICTADINNLTLAEANFDRVISIEMFEHCKNYQLLFRHVSGWLKPGGKMFVHIFTHMTYPFHFIDRGPNDWMARTFFSGGTMPSNNLFLYFQDDLTLEDHWVVEGTHYSKTLEAWLSRMDANLPQIRELFTKVDTDTPRRRMFFIAASENWNYNNGSEYVISHYRFVKPL